MGREVDRMLNQLERSYRAESWPGSAVLEALAGVDASQAAQRPLAAAHTIWELVLHMTYWKDIVRRRLAGERPETDDAMNFPEVQDPSPAAWARALANLEAVHEALVQEVAQVDDGELDEPAPGGTTPRYVTIHGIVQHDLYHAGQIAILRKPVAKSRQLKPRKAARRRPAASRKQARKKPSAGSRATRGAAARRKKPVRKRKRAR